ncbi:hypothetical protein EXE25_09190 [Acinetobacter bouvetii]|uniref:Uncharacterized protein n=1 Tax=Acinetobacter bouvetii TaxID=202951 RepID=A0A4Q7AXY8_9GAMM|nr:hypothetical protein [Acinetobacter bouvetii]RZG66850.1 hypothetical protein EXE25_09190 [Acinetobacter bouvetii]
MQIVITATNKLISASELMLCTLRTDLVPVPLSFEFSVKATLELEAQLKVGAEILVGNISQPLEIVLVRPVKSQTVKDDRRIGAISCIAVLSGCQKLIVNTDRAIIQTETSFNAAIRASGVKNIRFGDDLPLPEFICLKGRLPTVRLALYLQQEAAVICFRDNKLNVLKLDSLFKQDPVLKLDFSEVSWLNSNQKEKLQKSSYVSVDQDGSTVIGDNTTTAGQAVIQRAGLDARQLKNLEKVLIPRGTIERPLNMELMAGSVVEISQNKYVILTAAHQVETGAVGGNVGSITKLWLASL